MRIATLAVAGTLAVVLAGCSDTQFFKAGAASRAKANPHLCDQPGDDCPTIAVDPAQATWVKDPIVVFGKRKRNLVFEVAAGYEFDPIRGIEVADPDRKYVCTKDTGNARRYLCEYTYRPDKFGLHKYTIRVKRSGGAALDPYDPFFINE